MKRLIYASLLALCALPALGQVNQPGGGGGGLICTGTAPNQTCTVGTLTAGSAVAGFNQITAWGDSLTAGNEDGTGISYPGTLATLIGQVTSNQGVGGQTSSQIAVRMNAYAGQVQQQFTSGFTIPTSGTVNIPYFYSGYAPVTNQSSPVQITIASTPPVTGYVAWNSGAYTFTPSTYPGSPVTVANGTGWTPVLGNSLKGLVIIWAGRNNYTACTTAPVTTGNCVVAQDIAAMVAAVNAAGGKYLVLTVLNSELEWSGSTNYNVILAISTWIAVTYPSNYSDVRTSLVNSYNPSNAADVIDYGNSVPPYSLRAQDASGTVTAVNSTSTCAITFSNAVSTVGQNSIITLGTELIYLTGGTNGAWTCTRGYASTTAATHTNGTTYTAVDPVHLGQNATSPSNPNCTNGYICVANRAYSWITTAPSLGGVVPLSGLYQILGSLVAPTIVPNFQVTSLLQVGSSTSTSQAVFKLWNGSAQSQTMIVSGDGSGFQLSGGLLLSGTISANNGEFSVNGGTLNIGNSSNSGNVNLVNANGSQSITLSGDASSVQLGGASLTLGGNLSATGNLTLGNSTTSAGITIHNANSGNAFVNLSADASLVQINTGLSISGQMKASSNFVSNSVQGVTCATGLPSSSFASTGGIVTHC